MKNVTKIKKARLVLRILLMFCWAGMGHRILNRNLWDNLETTRKNNLAPYKDIFLHASSTWMSNDTKNWKNPDLADNETYGAGNTGHTVEATCIQRANNNITAAKNHYLNKQYDLAAYKLGYAMHYIQDMACPVHNARLNERTKYNYDTKYSDLEIHAIFEGGTFEGKDYKYETLYPNTNDFKSCWLIGSCPAYNSSLWNYVSGRETALTNMVGAKTGVVFDDPAVKAYLKDRIDPFLTHYNNKNTVEVVKAIKYNLAMAICIQKRYLKNAWKEIANY